MIEPRATSKRPREILNRENEGPDKKIPRLQLQDPINRNVFSAAPALNTRKELYDHFKMLKEDMESLDVANKLKVKGLLDPSSYMNIVQKKTRRRRVDTFIKELHKAINNESVNNVKAYKMFLEALDETGQAGIRKALQTPVTPYRPDTHEAERLFAVFKKKEIQIRNEIEPLKFIDDVVVFRGLHFHDHEEIMKAKCRKTRVTLLLKHLITSRHKDSWRILLPLSKRCKKLFEDSSDAETASSNATTVTTPSSHTASASTTPLPDAINLTASTSTTTSSAASSSSDMASAKETPSITLSCRFKNIRQCSIAVTETAEHDYENDKMNKYRELEKGIVDKINRNPEKYSSIAKLMDDCASSFAGLTVGSIRIHFQALSNNSLEKLKQCCVDGRVKACILSLLDEETMKNLKELEATGTSLDIYVDEREDFLQIFDETEEGCLCILNVKTVEDNIDYLVENIKDSEATYIDTILKSNLLSEVQANTLSQIKECKDTREKGKKLIEFLFKGSVCQTLFCLLEEGLIKDGNSEVVIRIQQTQPCKISNVSKSTPLQETWQLRAADLREHSDILEDEIDARWFSGHLQSCSDTKSLEVLSKIQASQCRRERNEPFLEYLFDQDDLHWFVNVLEEHHKHLLDIFRQGRNNKNDEKLKLAFMSAYDAIIDDIEPLLVIRRLPTSFLQNIDVDLLKSIETRQERASFFIRKVLGGSSQRMVDVLNAMRNSYNDIVTTIENILEFGSLNENYKCPRIRRVHGKLPTCVFSTDIYLFEENEVRTAESVVDSQIPLKRSSTAHGFVEAEITKYDKNKRNEKAVHWASYGRFYTNIGVIGPQRSCKELLLHALCGRIETDEETAPIYVEKNFKKFASYKEARIVTFWDLPEIGTDEFPRETYLRDIDFKRYDCFVIIVPGNLENNGCILIAKELAHLHRKVLLIRTNNGHVSPLIRGQPIAHCSTTSISDKQLVDTVRSKSYEDLKDLGVTEVTLFLINEDAIQSTEYDFDKLIEKLTEEVSNDNFKNI